MRYYFFFCFLFLDTLDNQINITCKKILFKIFRKRNKISRVDYITSLLIIYNYFNIDKKIDAIVK